MKAQRGFTLIEVMVALAVVAIAMAALLQGMGMYARHYGDMRDRFWSQNIGWNQLSKIQVAQEVGRLNSLIGSGSEQQLNANWKWEIDRQSTAADAIIRLDIQVAPSGSKSQTRLSTMIMRGSGFDRRKLNEE